MEQVISGGYGNYIPAVDELTEYNSLYGGYEWVAGVNDRYNMISTSGTFTELLIEVTGAPGAGDSWDFNLYVDGAVKMTVTIAGAAQTTGSTTGSVAVTPGQKVALQCVAHGTPVTWIIAYWATIFEGDNKGESLLLGGGRPGDYHVTANRYNNLAGGTFWETAGEYRDALMPTNGAIKNLYIELENAPGVDKSVTFTLMKGGALQTLAVTITGAAKTGNDTTHSISVAAGDLCTIQCNPNNSPTVGQVWWGFTFVADIDGESITFCNARFTLDDTATEYNRMTCDQDTWTATCNDRRNGIAECTVRKLYVHLSGTSGAGKSYTFTLRKNCSTDTELVVALANIQAGHDTTHEAAFSDFDLFTMKVVPAGTPTVQRARYAVVYYIPPIGVKSTLHLKMGLGGYDDQGGRIQRVGPSSMTSRPYNRLH